MNIEETLNCCVFKSLLGSVLDLLFRSKLVDKIHSD
jgi:hypothetical protein